MADRQDIDALLIGALYGELTPADEARLATHLEANPDDRRSLDGMTTAREAVRASRILATQAEPPQSVSAMLLQEAARRAPKAVRTEAPTEGWFQRFVRSFVAHPAMAAAASLVLVVGVAGSLYLRRGTSTFVETTVASRAPDMAAPAAPAAAAEAPSGPTGSAAMSPVATGAAIGGAGSAGDVPAEPAVANLEEAEASKQQARVARDGYAVDLDQGVLSGKGGGAGGAEGQHGKADDGKLAAPMTKELARADRDSAATAFDGKAEASGAANEKNAKVGAKAKGGIAGDEVGFDKAAPARGSKDRYVEVHTAKPPAEPQPLDDAEERYAQPPAAMAPTSPSRGLAGAAPSARPADGDGAGGVLGGAVADGADARRREGGQGQAATVAPSKKALDAPRDPGVSASGAPGGAAAGKHAPEAKPMASPSPSPSKAAHTAAKPAATSPPKLAPMPPPPPAPAPKPDVAPVQATDASVQVDATTAWARKQHARLRQLVADGSCAAAANIAVAISSQAPGYYAQNVANSRELKQCAQYVDGAREKASEKAAKVRAKANGNEPAAAPAQQQQQQPTTR